MDRYRRRVIDTQLDELSPVLSAILLDGPKGVGKTATALQRANSVRRLDRPAERAIAEADPDAVAEGDPPVLLDEWQRAPAVWDAVKRAVDDDGTGGRFLLTGSAPPIGTLTHSGAGRITTLRMRPMTLPERGQSEPSVSLSALLTDPYTRVSGRSSMRLGEYVDAILASGFPGFLDHPGGAASVELDGYIDRIVERDVPEAGLSVRRPATLRAWLAAYAATTATTTQWEKIRNAATPGQQQKPARSTVAPYLDVLSNLRIIDELPAWAPTNNHLRQLGLAAKHHLADPALAARLVGVGRAQLIAGLPEEKWVTRDGPFLGALFESLTALSVRVFAQACQARTSHLRTRDGRSEVDLIVEAVGNGIAAIEVKLSDTVTSADVRHLQWLRQRLGDRVVNSVVINTGPRAYRRTDGIAVVPLALLGP
ncbi:MAG: uncharacterized protein QG597_4944 [Actinomycetota bacterium]|nr:uncharacterized protein [Actinomycetota bacterium]